MIVYKGSDVIFDHEPPKWNFWTSSSVEKNHSYARTCAFVQEEGNATGNIEWLCNETVNVIINQC